MTDLQVMRVLSMLTEKINRVEATVAHMVVPAAPVARPTPAATSPDKAIAAINAAVAAVDKALAVQLEQSAEHRRMMAELKKW